MARLQWLLQYSENIWRVIIMIQHKKTGWLTNSAFNSTLIKHFTINIKTLQYTQD